MSSVASDATVVATDSHVSTTVDGETVLLNREQGTYQGLQGVGPRVWELIQEPTTVRTIVETIATEYDVDPERCEREITEFLGELLAERLAEIDDRPGE